MKNSTRTGWSTDTSGQIPVAANHWQDFRCQDCHTQSPARSLPAMRRLGPLLTNLGREPISAASGPGGERLSPTELSIVECGRSTNRSAQPRKRAAGMAPRLAVVHRRTQPPRRRPHDARGGVRPQLVPRLAEALKSLPNGRPLNPLQSIGERL
jgi:hypothetical protein